MDKLHVGEVDDVTTGRRVRVEVCLGEHGVYLLRVPVQDPDPHDIPVTLVTFAGLLSLSQGPFKTGYVEDHL